MSLRFNRIIEAFYAVPAVCIGFKDERVFAGASLAWLWSSESRLTSGLPAPSERPVENVISRGLSSRLCTNNTELLRQS